MSLVQGPNRIVHGVLPLLRPRTKPSVVIAGAGVADLTTVHHLLQRGFDVTLIEADDFVGGKLGAHQESDPDTGAATAAAERFCESCKSQGGCLARLARNFDAESHEFYTPGPALHLPLDGSVILALPLSELRRLVTLQIADWAPHLPNVRYLA